MTKRPDESDDAVPVARPRTRDAEGRISVRWDVIVTVVAWLVGGLLAYGSLDGRIRVLEAQMQGVAIDLKEIKGDLKLLLRGLNEPQR